MRFESQWPATRFAAPIWGMYDREGAFFESLGGRSWNRVDRRSDQADVDPMAIVLKDWRDTVLNLASGISAPELTATTAAWGTDTAPTDFAGWRARISSIASIVAELWS
jgi:hypothetical protein